MMLGLLGMLASGLPTGAADFGLSVTGAPNPVLVNQPVTYDIAVSNQTGLTLSVVFLTNEFSAPVRFLAATNTIPVTLATNANTVIVQYTPFSGSQTDLFTLVILPTTFGKLTNTVTVASFARTNATTDVVLEVIAGQPDLGIALTGPAQAVLVNDWMTYTLTVTNQGSDAAANVSVSNNFPADFRLISLAPSNQVVTVTNNILHWTVGTLAIGGSGQLHVTAQPTNSGVATLSASVSAPDVLDTNTVNDAASTNFDVGPLVAGSLVASNVTAMTFNPQTGLMEQTVRIVNVGTNAVASARIIVSELTNRLFNAVGTNDGNPFVVYGATLETNQSVDLVLEYFVPTRLPIMVADSQLHAFGAPAANLAAPPGAPIPPPAPRIVMLNPNRFLIEFPSTPGATYTVLYRDGSISSNELAAQPAIVAPADRVQWLDYGPPKTVSLPASVSSRFYRVIQNP